MFAFFKKLPILYLTFFLFQPTLRAQTRQLDSLQTLLDRHPRADTTRVYLLNELAESLINVDNNRSARLGRQALALAQKLHHVKGEIQAAIHLTATVDDKEAFAYAQLAVKKARRMQDPILLADALNAQASYYSYRGDYHQSNTYATQAFTAVRSLRSPIKQTKILQLLARNNQALADYVKALTYGLQSLTTAYQTEDAAMVSYSLTLIGNTYQLLGDYGKALQYLQSALKPAESIHYQALIGQILNGLGEIYRLQGKYPQAIQMYERCIAISRQIGNEVDRAINVLNLADVYERQSRYALAFQTAHQALGAFRQTNAMAYAGWVQGVLARIHQHTHRLDSALVYGHLAFQTAQQTGEKEIGRDASRVLAQAYAQRRDFADAYRYQTFFAAYQDSLNNDQTARKAIAAHFDYELAQKQNQIALLTKDKALQNEESHRQRQLLYEVLVVLALIAGLVFILFRSNRQKQRDNALLQSQKTEIQNQRDQLDSTLTELKATQDQLIQKEKMASLGELTAGIAHEIQNPLNFVNNFAKLSVGLLDEMKTERQKPERDGPLEDDLLDDLEQNLVKISHHGSRADSIVKAMLEHSRASTGQKQPIDLNALVGEYLGLAYHGLRAKDKTFNAELITHFDPAIGQLAVVPQDLGRVLLNLYNNAFYAIRQKQQQTNEAYQPTVEVRTKRQNGHVLVQVRDNGTGIPPAIIDKICQPFFTTKPAGQGTGLGLSLSYDIVTKGHGGTLEVISQTGDFTEFSIKLPQITR